MGDIPASSPPYQRLELRRPYSQWSSPRHCDHVLVKLLFLLLQCTSAQMWCFGPTFATFGTSTGAEVVKTQLKLSSVAEGGTGSLLSVQTEALWLALKTNISGWLAGWLVR